MRQIPLQFDLRLLVYIHNRGGRVTVRQLTSSLASCPRAADAKRQLTALVQAELGIWAPFSCGATGGRPTRTFVLTASKEILESALRLATGAVGAKGPIKTRQIIREVIKDLNRYQTVPCRQLAEALAELTGIFNGLASNQCEALIPLCNRTITMSARGALTSLYDYKGPR